MGSLWVYSRRVFLVLAGLVGFYLLAGCSTLPQPKNDRSSLLVLVAESPRTPGAPLSDRIVLAGPLPLRLNLTSASSGIFISEVPPGRYRVLSRTIRWRDGTRTVVRNPSGAEVEVAPGEIVLPAWRFSNPVRGAGTERNGVEPTHPADRRHAAALLKDFVAISEWAGRSVSGFTPYSPFTDYAATKFTMRVESTPPGAQIVIDGQAWGDTPLSVSLSPGKHFVRLTRAGYQAHTSFINVGANGTERFSLSPAPVGEKATSGSKATVMIEPFKNLGEQRYGNIAAVLTGSLAVAFRHEGIDIVGSEPVGTTNGSNGGTGLDPQAFGRAEKAGAEAFVAGDYTANDRSILIHAALYDTRTGLVRASVLFEGKGGTSLFDSIDKMSNKLGSAVEKVLPEVGQAVVKERVLSPRSVVFNTRVREEEVIHKRNEKKYSITLGPALAGVMDGVTDPSNPTSSSGRFNGPGIGINAGLDLPMTGPLSIHLATMPMLFTDAAHTPKVEIPLYFGPRYTFSGFMSDVYVGLQGAIHYAPSSAVSFNGGSSTTTVGPFWLFGLNFETGVNVYTYRRLSALPFYYGVGLRLGFFGYRFDLNFTNPTLYPMEVALRVYLGARL